MAHPNATPEQLRPRAYAAIGPSDLFPDQSEAVVA